MQGLAAAQRQYDSYLPEDNRTDEEIEADAAEWAREIKQAAARKARLQPTQKALTNGHLTAA